MERKRILVVGAGLAGLALYRALDRQKFEVTLVERRENFANLGYSVVLMPNGIRALRKLGFPKKTIDSLGRPMRELTVRDAAGKTTSVGDVRTLHKKYDRYVMADRKDIHALLERGIKKNEVRFLREVTAVKQAKGKVSVRFKGDRRMHEFDLVVGADGANSAVRACLFPKARITPHDIFVIWGWVPRGEIAIGERTLAFAAQKRGIGYFDTGGKKVCAFFWAEREIMADKPKPAAFARVWKEYLQDFKLEAIGATTAPPKKEMLAHEGGSLDLRSWKKGNVILIGDAAHVRGVFTGSGTALAIEDGYVLGELLNETGSLSQAMKRFCDIQQPRARMMEPTLIGSDFVRLIDRFLSKSVLWKR